MLIGAAMAEETTAPVAETVQLAAPEVSAATDGETTDEPLREPGKKALEAERAARRKLEAELKQLRDLEQQRVDSEKSDLQKAVERAERAERAAVEAERKAFAAEKGIPGNLLSGATPDEWQASADALLAFRGGVQPAKPVAPRAEGVQGGTGQPVTTNAGQMSRADLARMTPEQIVKAQSEGRLDAVLGIKH